MRNSGNCALRAFGEGVASVVRARMVIAVMDGLSVRVKQDDGTYIELLPSDAGARLTRTTPPSHGNMEQIRAWQGNAHDYAVEAVSLLLEEIARPPLDASSTARAEAALAEREAIVGIMARRAEQLRGSADDFSVGDHHLRYEAAREELLDLMQKLARTTPATLSTDTLAAIAEARGLRLVEPEHLAELEAAAKSEREACAAEVSALLEQVQREIDTTYPTGRALDELVAARTVLQKAAVMIGTRSIGGAK